MNVTIARQPIFTTKQTIMGYELLYRRDLDALDAELFDDVSATAQVISGSLLEIGMTNMVGESKAFINFPRAYLLNPSGVPLDKNQVVIEVLENSGFDALLLASLRKWVKAGYKLALDDFEYEAKLLPFVELATYIKLDLQELGRDKFMQQMEALKTFDVKIVAEKIETWEEFNFCEVLGVDYYQGYFFERPEIVTKKATKVNSMTLLQLMAELLKGDNLNVNELESIVSRDIGLVHKLLKFLNSPITGLSANVDSVRLAIVLVGVDQLKSLTNLLLMSELVGDRHVLLEAILLRAKHAELISIKLGHEHNETYFLAGMLSMMDACVGISLPEVLKQLPLPREFINAIIERSGNVGNVLDMVEQFGKGHKVTSTVSIEDLKSTYVESLEWVDDFLSRV
ncbi:EAL domain-containing protein [Marinomonas sp. 15G1-11]|uniref:EAL domain-containing protein n=1 Tax=Marinomonas phaeophyticola TaxID=3004091 RepID=A0ABT4JUR5_9GAMM|nr:HDOD domain-containing protein [Marinomonas sp. 15G1-11]MCZ2722090.1 EAL domain-containing protein [Marinomonas sp. 15G1-11]